MDAFKRLSLATLAVILAGSVAPALAQDTRPQPDRPTIERGDDGGSETADAQEPRLPKSTDGVRCLIEQTHGGPEVTVVNGTGKVIPAGTVVTFYMQPGNIQKLFTLAEDWEPGQSIVVPVKLAELPDNAECSLRLAPVQSPEPQPEPPEEEPEPPEEGPKPDGNGEWVPPEGSVPVGEVVACGIYDNQYAQEPTMSYLSFSNVSGGVLPVGTKILTKMPDGTVHEFILEVPFFPGGDWSIPMPEGIPAKFECSFEVILP